MRMIAIAVCSEVGLTRTGVGGIGSTSRSTLHIVSRALTVDIGRHYQYSYAETVAESGYETHSSAIDAQRRLNAGLLDGTVKTIDHKIPVLSAMIIADIDSRGRTNNARISQ